MTFKIKCRYTIFILKCKKNKLKIIIIQLDGIKILNAIGDFL